MSQLNGIIGGIAYSPRNFGDDIHHYPEQVKDNPVPLQPHGDHSLKDFKISLYSLCIYDHVRRNFRLMRLDLSS
jgi:hypothetical protein